MCGFAGYIVNGLMGDRKAIIKAMADRIRHRGPDQDDYYLDDDIALGFRRLSIIDLEGGSQPILNEDGSMVLTFNGEIYNFKELREDLIQKGHVFKTHTDSEVLLHGYEEYGSELLQKLRGMYAFVIWDRKQKKLFGARDIFGIKPFYYYKKGGEFLFGSEIKSFLEHPRFEKELNEDHLPDYLCYEYIPCEETLFKNVYKLLGGHYFEYQNGEMSIHQYYDVKFNTDESKSLEEWEALITDEFTKSVEAHKISDVEVGCFLSSGVDSSYVVKEVSKAMKDVKTFSVGYEEEKYSELPYAQDFSKVIGVQNISNKVSADDFFGMAGKIQYYMDEPLPNPSEVPLYFLAENAAKYVKVVLSGEGADELFGGYPMYLEGGHFADYERIPLALRKTAAAIAKKLPHFKGKKFIIRGAMKPYERFARSNYVYTSEERGKYLKKNIPSKDPTEYAKPYFDKVKDLDEPTQLQYVDIYTWMLYDILQKADRMSMANSLELRVPFLDKKMLELAVQIPARYRAHNDVTKIALRGAAIKQIPERTANKKKLGFPVPLNDWLRQDKYYSMVKEKFEGEIADRYFNRDAIMKLLNDHKEGRALNMKKIWSIYSFILWYEQFFVLN
ncbi:asparagine synthase (glutamine-hydrolyzing) [Fumia xinanensis]|uniref:asparagine synthase (glutamine-hydrolyzing) n=1 Tax=Fumia xinanensis TaxID=2763659 RepID=A0A926E7W7_9FIRM|nr:asparagine synthase (glutamine-hydrolyzing) [Fumia xinanensis]MBC8560801.1 asparagine synthase (glutamine-hydrolyzing) [Fumia xinanensis]